jgi:hypothetical protein
MQLILSAELLHGRCSGDLEVHPTDLRRTSATGRACTLTVVAGGGAPFELKSKPSTFPRAGNKQPEADNQQSINNR